MGVALSFPLWLASQRLSVSSTAFSLLLFSIFLSFGMFVQPWVEWEEWLFIMNFPEVLLIWLSLL